jgi:hypothetical protein
VRTPAWLPAHDASIAGPGYLHHAGDVKSKVLIDATNPLTPYPGLEVFWNGNTSGGGACLTFR